MRATAARLSLSATVMAAGAIPEMLMMRLVCVCVFAHDTLILLSCFQRQRFVRLSARANLRASSETFHAGFPNQIMRTLRVYYALSWWARAAFVSRKDMRSVHGAPRYLAWSDSDGGT